MAAPSPVPSDHFTSGDFLGDCRARGSRLLPRQRRRRRRAAVVLLRRSRTGRGGRLSSTSADRQAARAGRALIGHAVLPRRRRSLPRRRRRRTRTRTTSRGMPEFLDRFGSLVREFWEPGYYHPSVSYMETMRAIEDQPSIQHSQPTSGLHASSGRCGWSSSRRRSAAQPLRQLRGEHQQRLDRTQDRVPGLAGGAARPRPPRTCGIRQRRRCSSAPMHRRSRGGT